MSAVSLDHLAFLHVHFVLFWACMVAHCDPVR
uniref:Uncharacterized protein n=1 Tax=Anguilla anguilla TaxID=7936 RepID=A0A0E9SFS4_ANGAN